MKTSTPYSQVVTFCLAACLSITLVTSVAAQTRQEPISYYTSRVAPNRPEVNGWTDPISGNLIDIDALGRQNARFGLNLPTTVSGSVRITTLQDGTEQATVDLVTENALCWGYTFDENLGYIPAFGYRPSLVAGGHVASTGTQRLHIAYRPQPAGQFTPRGGIYSIRATVSCDGTMRGESGFIDGGPGRAYTTQIGLYMTGVPSGCPPEHDGDCYTAERVGFIPTGN